ncbi:MAG: hypothetical protein ACQGQP_10015, partial [Desulfovibrio sp.]
MRSRSFCGSASWFLWMATAQAKMPWTSQAVRRMIVCVDTQRQNHPLGAKMQVVWHGTAAVEVRCLSGRLLF